MKQWSRGTQCKYVRLTVRLVRLCKGSRFGDPHPPHSRRHSALKAGCLVADPGGATALIYVTTPLVQHLGLSAQSEGWRYEAKEMICTQFPQEKSWGDRLGTRRGLTDKDSMFWWPIWLTSEMSLGYKFVFCPSFLGAVIMVAVACITNNMSGARTYPQYWWPSEAGGFGRPGWQKLRNLGFAWDDVDQCRLHDVWG